MTNQDERFPKARRSDVGDSAAGSNRVPRRPLGRAGSVSRPEVEVELDLAELVGDANGEVVFFNDSGFRTLGLCSAAAVVADGRSGRHITAAGADVSGCNYVTFDNGLTLYYGSDVDLIIRNPTEDERR